MSQDSASLSQAVMPFYDFLGENYTHSVDQDDATLPETEIIFYDFLGEKDHHSADQDAAALPEADVPFYDFLGEMNPHSTDLQVSGLSPGIVGCDKNYFVGECSYGNSIGQWCPNRFFDPIKHNDCVVLPNSSVELSLTMNSQLSNNNGLMNSHENTLNVQNKVTMPMTLNCENSDYCGLKGKRKLHDDVHLELDRSNKQPIAYNLTVRSETFDMVLLDGENNKECAIRKAIIDSQSKEKKSRGRHGGKLKVIDFTTLLMPCAEAVGNDNRRVANDTLKQIRQHSSLIGDGMERLAYYFADGLEARLYGYGAHIYKDLISFPVAAVDVLRIHQLYIATCPYSKISISFSNTTICNAAKNVPRLHIVDFGILYGFQWPSLIQRLSSRSGGPPALRITGIDFPHPDRSSQRVEETRARLASYAETFNVPFEFHAIAQEWETINMKDIDIRDNEVLIVNCLNSLTNLLDESVVINNPRDRVLNLIREMKPHTFIMGMVNGPCNASFFMIRFKEALDHYSSLFGMLDVIIPRQNHERALLEKLFFAKEAMNVIACEGTERVERHDTYMQWHSINMRSGFRQLALNKKIVDTAKQSVKAYHKDFSVYEDRNWLLQGWKGRPMHALSSWRSE